MITEGVHTQYEWGEDRVRAVGAPAAFVWLEHSLRNAEAHVHSIVSAITLRLRYGRVGIDGTAALLGVSVRTLQRRLKSIGLNYRSLLELVRQDRAIALLESTSLTITEIAMELGYSEHANFTRAFRRWAGQSPQLYRQQVLTDAGDASRPSTGGNRDRIPAHFLSARLSHLADICDDADSFAFRGSKRGGPRLLGQ